MASFGSVGNASKLRVRLEGLGYRVLTDTVESDVGTLNRVRVGPFHDSVALNNARNLLNKQNIDSRVIKLTN